LSRWLQRFVCRYGTATWLGAIHAACGVYMGDPIRLFPAQAADAGIPAGEACVLARTLVSGNAPTVIDATGAALYELASPEYSTLLSWQYGGGNTMVHVTLSDIKVYSVAATRNPDSARWSQSAVCVDHVTIEGALALRTEDGRLDEHVGLIQLVAYDDFEAHGSVSIERDALVGAYQSSAAGGECFVRLKVRLLVARDGVHGTLGEDIELGACDDPLERPITEFASARWGQRFNNYGD
jgi:hypothetical protein